MTKTRVGTGITLDGMLPALEWVQAETGRRVVSTRKLRGGLTSEVGALTLDDNSSLVLKCYESRQQASLISHEADVLRRLARADIPAPRFVAASPIGEQPRLLMTRVPGRIWLTPRDPKDWVQELAASLARIHDVPISANPGDPAHDAVAWLELPAWTSRRTLWERTREILKQPPSAYRTTFTHGDYQHFNVLWSRRRISGVLDWCGAGPGHPDADAAHCRLNLAILFSVDVAEQFREAYEATKGSPLDPWWDLHGLTSYDNQWKHFIPLQVAGRARVDAAGMDDRVEGLMARTLTRL